MEGDYQNPGLERAGLSNEGTQMRVMGSVSVGSETDTIGAASSGGGAGRSDESQPRWISSDYQVTQY